MHDDVDTILSCIKIISYQPCHVPLIYRRPRRSDHQFSPSRKKNFSFFFSLLLQQLMENSRNVAIAITETGTVLFQRRETRMFQRRQTFSLRGGLGADWPMEYPHLGERPEIQSSAAQRWRPFSTSCSQSYPDRQ